MKKQVTREDIIQQTHLPLEEEEKANKYASAAYLLTNVSENKMKKAFDVLNKYGIVIYDLKYAYGNLKRAYVQVWRLLEKKLRAENGENVLKSIDHLNNMVDEFLNEQPEKWNWKNRYYFSQSQLKKQMELYKILQFENEELKKQLQSYQTIKTDKS